MKRLILVLVAALFLGWTASASAALIDLGSNTGAGELRIYQIYNAIYGGYNYTDNNDLESNENDFAIANGTYVSNSGYINKVARYAGNAVTLDYYDIGGDHNIVTNLAGATQTWNPPVFLANVPAAGWFGLEGDTVISQDPFHSQSFLNSDGKYHFLVLNTPDPNKLLIGYEDMTDPETDWDYNDFVFETVNLRPVLVPEPATMSLIGLGLLGLGAGRIRKRFTV